MNAHLLLIVLPESFDVNAISGLPDDARTIEMVHTDEMMQKHDYLQQGFAAVAMMVRDLSK